MEGIGFDLNLMQTAIEFFIVNFINTVAGYVSAAASVLPNPDPFPGFIENLAIDDGSVGAQAFFILNQFVDVATCVSILLGWFVIFAMGWIFQFFWNLFKLKNKG